MHHFFLVSLHTEKQKRSATRTLCYQNSDEVD
ncbi:MAG: hypothetical protein ACI9JY_000219 [Saprospiraceae bacterium]